MAILKVGKCREESTHVNTEARVSFVPMPESDAGHFHLEQGEVSSQEEKRPLPSSPGRCVALIVAMETWAAPEISCFTLSWGNLSRTPRVRGQPCIWSTSFQFWFLLCHPFACYGFVNTPSLTQLPLPFKVPGTCPVSLSRSFLMQNPNPVLTR